MTDADAVLTIIAPSLDDKRIYPVRRLDAGEVHRSGTVIRHASGKGANAARAAAALGTAVRLCALAGREMRAQLEEQFSFGALTIELAHTAQETRSCITVLEEDGRATEFVQEALPLEADARAHFTRIALRACAREGIVLLAGSLPPGLPVDFYMVCSSQAFGHGARVVIDAHDAPLLAALPARPDVVKINREELLGTTGESVPLIAAQQLIREGARAVVMTDGPRPVLLLQKDVEERWFTPPEIIAVNPVGSGDAFSGALARALLIGLSLPDAVRHGIAAGAANAVTLLPGEVDPAAFTRFLDGLD